MPGPEHHGEPKAEIRTSEITYINIRQQKTGAKVAVNIYDNRIETTLPGGITDSFTGAARKFRNYFVGVSDFTTEVLVRQHKSNPRSLAVYVDELIGFNKYRSGNNEQIWTQLYNGGSVIVNRVSSQPLNIEDTCIGVIGTIQPGLLYEFAKGKTESGFVDRWLFVCPDDSEYPKMTKEQLPKEITRSWCDIIDRIFKLMRAG